jgi:hypothetical protein
MSSEVAVAHAIAENNSGRMKLGTAVKDFAVPRSASGRKAAEYGDDGNRSVVAYKRM